MLVYALAKDGYACFEAGNVEEAHTQVRLQEPDIILLDWMLPGTDGIEYLQRLKGVPGLRDIPVIMLTARGVEGDRVRGLESGADDYIIKPFSTRELLARIKAILRRVNLEGAQNIVAVEDLVLNSETYRVTIKDENIEVSPMEFKLLHFFISHPERVYSRSQLLGRVWGENVYVEERTVDVHIRRLRKTLEPYGYHHYIQTVRSVGYRFSTH